MNGKNIEVRQFNDGLWGVFILPEDHLFFAHQEEHQCQLIASVWKKGYNTATWQIRDAVEAFKVI